MPAGAPRIVAVTPGPPFDPLTWSGISHNLLGALERRGALTGAVDGWSRPLNLLEKAASVARDEAIWRQRYLANSSVLSPHIRRGMTALARRRVRRLDPRPGAVLQFGAWYDLTGGNGLEPGVSAFYADGNLALSLDRDDNRLERSSRSVRRALEYERRLYDRLDVIMTMSAWLGRSFVEQFGQDPAKVVPVGAGANFSRRPEPVERPPRAPRLLFVGREFERKGGHVLLEAFAALRDRHPEAELDVVSTYRPERAQPGVTFHGRILRDTPEGEARIARLYRDASVFVLPSVYEPFGIAFLEAMAYGLPCVGTRVCAIPEMIEDGVTGVLVAPGDADSLASSLDRLLSDRDAAAAMGNAGRERFDKRFTWDAVADRMVTAIAERGAQGPPKSSR